MKSKEQLNTQIEQTVYPNTQGLIDAQKIQDLLKEVVDSGVNKMTDAPLDNNIYGLKNQAPFRIDNLFALKTYVDTSDSNIYNSISQTVDLIEQDGDIVNYTYNQSDGTLILDDTSYVFHGVVIEYGTHSLVLVRTLSNSDSDLDLNGVYSVVSQTTNSVTLKNTYIKPIYVNEAVGYVGNPLSYVGIKRAYQALSVKQIGTFYELI